MNMNYSGDRECPNCQQDSLVESSSKKWKCLICENVYDEKCLDASEE